jgi:hypothetical protein
VELGHGTLLEVDEGTSMRVHFSNEKESSFQLHRVQF